MLQNARRCFALVLSMALIVSAQGNTFTKVRYNGGTVSTTVKPDDWDNTLIVSSDLITFKLKDRQVIDIDPKNVTGLSYGEEAHRRVGTMIALGILLSPLALFGLFHKTRLHYISIEYKLPNGKGSALLLQGDKSNYRAILVALQGTTGLPVAVSEQDRPQIPVGVKTETAPVNPPPAPAPAAAPAPVPAPSAAPPVAPPPTTPQGEKI